MPTHALESLTGRYSVGGFIGVLEARSRCSGISAAADSTSPFFLCLQSPDCISFFFLGSVFSYHFVSTCKLMTVGIHPPITINMTFLCMPAVSSWARYILVFRLLSFHGRQGDASSRPFLSLTTFLCWTYPMCFLCVFGCSLSWCHPWQSQFIASPFGQRHQRDNSATAPEAGEEYPPPRSHSVALALFSWIISSAIVNISWILSSLTSLSILTQHSPVLVRSSPLAFTRSVMFCLSSSDVYL